MSEERVFSFDLLIEKLHSDGPSLISCLEEGPVVDVIAIGFENGIIALVNLLYNEVLLTLDQSSDGGPIKSMTFSSDTEIDISLLASVSQSKHGGTNIVLWDLNKKMISSTLKQAHSDHQVSFVKFMPAEPVLISTSEGGNSIKMWLLEKGQALPRLLR